jgi:hypothetical protein
VEPVFGCFEVVHERSDMVRGVVLKILFCLGGVFC